MSDETHNPMKQPRRRARTIPKQLLQRIIDPELQHRIAAHGLKPTAIRGHAETRATGQSPRRAGPATICRLYPTSPHARYAFAIDGQICAEAIVFEDPTDNLAWNLNAGYENALHAAQTLLHARNQ